MQPITVLVTGVGSPIGVGIIKCLRASSLPIRIIGVDAEPLAQGLFRVDRSQIVPSARQDPNAYMEALIALCQQESVRLLCSGWEGELPLFAEWKIEFERRTGAIMPFAPDATLKALDKWHTTSMLQAAGVGTPDSVLPADEVGLEAFRQRHAYPYIVKPRRSSGGKGLVLVQNDEELEFFCCYIPDPVIQERLLPDDQEYTVGVFLREDGSSVGALALKRSLSGGLSYRMESNLNKDACQVAIRAAQAMGSIGAVNAQMRLTDDGFKVFEINPRFSSATCVRSHFGLNELDLAVRHFVLKESLSSPIVKPGVCLRFWEELYLPIEAKAAAQQGEYTCRGEILHQF